VYPLTCRRWQEPVTSRAAPTKVISRWLTFRYGITLKQDYESLFILRHQRRLPSSSAPLIQQISESILVLARVPRQLDYHSLVFFHQELEIYEPLAPIVPIRGVPGQE
jgi:hypothetical protein